MANPCATQERRLSHARKVAQIARNSFKECLHAHVRRDFQSRFHLDRFRDTLREMLPRGEWKIESAGEEALEHFKIGR